jgi:4-diphosphocytidyl-2-C-methyl-D-erythritol kinase
MNIAKVTAYAKLNLTLDILGTKDGFHQLDSFVADVNLGDLIVAKKRKDKLCSIAMHGMGSEEISPEHNNALRAAEAFVEKFGTDGADIAVYKNIPIGAGLGGSSADAAGTINALAGLYGITDDEETGKLADALGSDVRYMLRGGFCRMKGRGEQIEQILSSLSLHFLLLCPNTPVSTAACYKEYDKTFALGGIKSNSATQNCIEAFLSNDINGVGRYLTNDLYLPATHLNEDVKTALEELKAFSPLGVSMTGSGSCVFALFSTRELCEWAKSRYRGKYRAYVVHTVPPAKPFRTPYRLNALDLLGDERR